MLGTAEFGESVVVADLEAGIGTLTRLAEGAVDVILVVVEPTPKSMEVARRATALAQERSVSRVVIVANRIHGEDDLNRIRDAFPDADIVTVPHDEAIVDADRRGAAPLDAAPDAPAVRALVGLAEHVAP